MYTGISSKKRILNKVLVLIAFIIVMLFLSSCDEDENDMTVSSGNIDVENDVPQQKITIDVFRDPNQPDRGVNNNSSENGEGDEASESDNENEALSEEEALSYSDKPVCTYVKPGKVKFDITFKNGIPSNDDGKVYLFEVSTYENENSLDGKQPLSSADAKDSMSFSVEYKQRYLFSRFVPAVLSKGSYVPVSSGQYITNPGELASVTKANPKAGKKGVLIDTTMMGTDNLTSLKPSRIIYNIPLSYVIGETTNAANPTVNYEYNGKVYQFNGHNLMLFDSIFTKMTNAGYHCTAILLNDKNPKHPELIHPLSRGGAANYYAFNTEDEASVRLMEATALFLAERYTKGDHGMVYDWIIGNEVNQHKIWNYMACDDLDKYAESFERSFRIFYNAIRSKYSNAKVYYSIDHDWNDNGGNNSAFFNAKDFLSAFNKCAKKRGNYNWSLAIHPYPVPLTNVKFWEGSFDKSENAKTLTPMNLSTLTSVMTKGDYLNSSGNVRDITITELGFSSVGGENLQAAAYAYCYYIVEKNNYISAFILNRQTDDPTEMKDGLAFGIYNMDHSPKYLTEVYKNVGTDAGNAYIPEMLSVIGASSLEEALARAR